MPPRLKVVYMTLDGRLVNGPRSNQGKVSKTIPRPELIRLKAKRCTVSLATEPSWTITVEAKNAPDQRTLSNYLSDDPDLVMPSTGSAMTEGDIARGMDRLKAMRQELGFTLILPEIVVAASEPENSTEGEGSVGSEESPTTATPSQRSDSDGEDILPSWEDWEPDDESITAKLA